MRENEIAISMMTAKVYTSLRQNISQKSELLAQCLASSRDNESEINMLVIAAKTTTYFLAFGN